VNRLALGRSRARIARTLSNEETGSGFPLIWCHEFGGDYRSWEPQVRDHSAVGSAHMLRGVRMKRKTIFELEPELKRLEVPSLIVVGDHDEPCLEPGLFNLHVAEFLAAVQNGRWGTWKAQKPGRRRAPRARAQGPRPSQRRGQKTHNDRSIQMSARGLSL